MEKIFGFANSVKLNETKASIWDHSNTSRPVPIAYGSSQCRIVDAQRQSSNDHRTSGFAEPATPAVW